jgi:uncharacterized membrane protein YjjP (DUF1212 family)
MRQRAVIVALVLASAFATYYFGREALIAAVSLCVGIFVDEALGRRFDVASIQAFIEASVGDAIDGLRGSRQRQS